MVIINGTSGNDTLNRTSDNDQITGLAGNDVITGGLWSDKFQISLIWAISYDTLTGGSKNDTLLGGDGNDILSGTGITSGLGSIDTLTGGNGNDRFILSSSAIAFYNDGNNATSGLGDYALIKDFSSTLDKIQLEGSASRYILGTSPIAGLTGTAIYLDTNGNKAFNSTDELLAVVQGSGSLSLGSSYFTYV